MSSFFWWTGLLVWLWIASVVAYRLAQLVILAYRAGWEKATSWGWESWLDNALNPPDCIDGVYFPSKGGRRMREFDNS